MTDPLAQDQIVERPYVCKEFRLLTSGADPEIDAIHIIVQALNGMDGDQVDRVLKYLTQRYERPF